MSASRIYNDQPRPRALLQDLPDHVAEPIAKLFPSHSRVEATDEVYEDEFDVLIANGAAAIERAGHLHTVAFGSVTAGLVDDRGIANRVKANYNTHQTRSSVLHVPDGITGELGDLVRTHLVPMFMGMTAKSRLSFSGSKGVPHDGGSYPFTDADPAEWCTPFLVAGDGSVLAGAFTRKGGGRCWVLPAGCPAPAAWVTAALKEFHEVSPERVPGLPQWWERPEWATLEQQRTRAVIADLEDERTRLLGELDDRLRAARSDVETADANAAAGAGRLLTADGDNLAHGVQAALEALGFEVEDMDQVHPDKDRREDLRVRDPDRPGWEVIVEVKGYTAGAKVNDLTRLLRWKSRYILDVGREPDALWHVVNAFRRTDPSVRSIPIPNDADLEHLIAENGVLIDSRHLFQAHRAVESGSADATKIRGTMCSTAGRWVYTAEAGPDDLADEALAYDD
jgi:hypothetical protein